MLYLLAIDGACHNVRRALYRVRPAKSAAPNAFTIACRIWLPQ
jgi:hypothetical protein